MQPLQNCIGPTNRISQEILCLQYAGYFLLTSHSDNTQNNTQNIDSVTNIQDKLQ